MTNQSPSEPPNPMPERRRRPATGVTFDEMLAIIIAFSTIGTILFWALGGRNGNLANNFGLGGESSLLASGKTTDTGVGFGTVWSDNNRVSEKNLDEQDAKLKADRLATQTEKPDTVVADFSATPKVNSSAKVEPNKSFSVDTGAKLAPLAGVAILPALRQKSENPDVSANKPPIKTREKLGDAAPRATLPGKIEPEAKTPENTNPGNLGENPPEKIKPEAKPPKVEKGKPIPITPETTKMPQDVVPSYWAYPFVKQMREKALVPELAKNQEFEPDALITRASMATLVSQAFSDQPQSKSVKKFGDVSKDNAIAKNIDQAVSSGFMQGYSDNEFKPEENIPRYQVLVTLATGLGLKPSQDADQILEQFSDRADMPDWAKEQVAAATEAGLVVNSPDAKKGSLVPEKPATRAEVAAMIHQALVKTGKLKPIESEYIVKP